jgi:hypothetical protein
MPTWVAGQDPPDAALSNGSGILKGAPVTSLTFANPELRILLGEVLNVSGRSIPQPNLGYEVTYNITILCEFRGSLVEGSKVDLQDMNHPGTGGLPLPTDWKPGTVFLVKARAVGENAPLQYAGFFRMLGVKMPCQVPREDIPLIRPALLKLGEISRRSNFMLTRDEAQGLFHNENNYYLWALGATGLAAYDDKVASSELYNGWINGSSLLSPRQIVWLDHCFGDVMSEGIGPDRVQRHDMLLDYLKRLSDRFPTTMPSTKQ